MIEQIKLITWIIFGNSDVGLYGLSLNEIELLGDAVQQSEG